ncbi:MAG: iron-containing alcohol dehydrogenase [Anaerolineae bacterium]|jgi:alcohol dehydrogenase class IV|nr:iron-containing alcohol dehydrogenase [Anaerolineae bacterium]
MNFEFATAGRIIFGRGSIEQAAALAGSLGTRALVVTGDNPQRAAPLTERLSAAGMPWVAFPVVDEPSIEVARAGVQQVQQHGCDVVIGCGGGSALDTAKAVAALAANPGDPLDYLEVIGQALPLVNAPLPCIAIPTTAGTGSEVTRNAVLSSAEHGVKVSLRHPLMLPRIALIDPALMQSLPPAATAATGMDALTQNIEPYVSNAANPLTDAFCREGIQRAARSLRQAVAHGDDLHAREDMALAALLGGLALANAKLGAVHGFAGVLGGMFKAPHGDLCAALLAPVMQVNLAALAARAPQHPARPRYEEIARWLTGDEHAGAEDGLLWVRATAQRCGIRGLAAWGIPAAARDEVVAKAARASSMKGNPIVLTDAELHEALELAW